MSDLNPELLHIRWMRKEDRIRPSLPRCYTLTHSDRTGELFLTIGPAYDEKQISGWYTRLMRDEVLAEWHEKESVYMLKVHCHVSGGLVLGSARWRYSIFQRHLRQVIQAFRVADDGFFNSCPGLDEARVEVHFHSTQEKFNRVETWGSAGDYQLHE